MLAVDLSNNEVQAILNKPESHFFDFKSKRIAPAKLSRIISSLANADGGEAYVGIEDEKYSGDRWI